MATGRRLPDGLDPAPPPPPPPPPPPVAGSAGPRRAGKLADALVDRVAAQTVLVAAGGSDEEFCIGWSVDVVARCEIRSFGRGGRRVLRWTE